MSSKPDFSLEFEPTCKRNHCRHLSSKNRACKRLFG